VLEGYTVDWLNRFGLLKTAEDAQTIKEFECGLYGGLSSPRSSLRDCLLITEFVTLWLFWDDRVIEESSGWSMDDAVSDIRADEVIDSPDGFLSAGNDLGVRLRKTQSARWMARLAAEVSAWMENAKLETEKARI